MIYSYDLFLNLPSGKITTAPRVYKITFSFLPARMYDLNYGSVVMTFCHLATYMWYFDWYIVIIFWWPTFNKGWNLRNDKWRKKCQLRSCSLGCIPGSCNTLGRQGEREQVSCTRRFHRICVWLALFVDTLFGAVSALHLCCFLWTPRDMVPGK